MNVIRLAYRGLKSLLEQNILFLLRTQRLYPPKTDYAIRALEGIGPGLFIQHGRATGVMAHCIGANCFINQNVVVGYKNIGDRPPIIGDNAIIGANAVVMKDVPPNCIVVGVPARIFKRNGKRVDEPLHG